MTRLNERSLAWAGWFRSICLATAFVLVSGAACACRGAEAADSTYMIEGTVVDPAGRSVDGASVLLEIGAGVTGASARTDRAGQFRVPAAAGAPRGVLVVTKPGFSAKRVLLDGSQTASLVIELVLGELATEVTVSAEAQQTASSASVPQRVNVVEGQALRRRAYWNVSAAAAEEPGVAVQQTSPSLGGVLIRGMSGDDVPVFVDGIRVTTSAARGGINTFFNLNNTTTLGAVELLRGPNTAQYGSDSLGGVVSLQSVASALSAGPVSTHFEAGGGYDSATHGFGSDLTVSHSRERLGLLGSVFGKRVNTMRPGGGLDSRSALTRFLGLPSGVLYERIPDSAFSQYGGMLHGQWATSEAAQVVFHYQRGQQDGGKRPDQLLSGDGNLVADLRNLMADLAYLRYNAFPNQWIDQVSVTGSFLAQREERRNQGGQGDRTATIRSEFERATVWGANAVLGRNRGRNSQFVFGGDSYLERLRARGTSVDPLTGSLARFRARIPDKVRYTQNGAFVQGAWMPAQGRLRLSGALRVHRASYRVRGKDAPIENGVPLFTADSLVASNLSGRAGAVYSLGGGVRLRGYYARGFRAPTATNLGTLGLTGNGYEVGSAELNGRGAMVGSTAGDDAVSTGEQVRQLKPELSDNVDAGVSWESGKVRLDVTGFWIERRAVIAKRALILPPGAVGSMLGDQPISAQENSGIVYVPLVPNPVLVRTNADSARFQGFEQELHVRITRNWQLSGVASYVHAADRNTGLVPDISAGMPAPNGVLRLRYLAPASRFWVEATADGSLRQDQISSVGLADRRVGASRSRSTIARYFARGAVVHGLVSAGPDQRLGTADDRLQATGETLAEVQNRVLGTASSAPLYRAIPGYLLLHLRGGVRLGEGGTLLLGVENLTDRNYRGMAWGIDGRGRSLVAQWQHRF